jgi:hypothetical protein
LASCGGVQVSTVDGDDEAPPGVVRGMLASFGAWKLELYGLGVKSSGDTD